MGAPFDLTDTLGLYWLAEPEAVLPRAALPPNGCLGALRDTATPVDRLPAARTADGLGVSAS